MEFCAFCYAPAAKKLSTCGKCHKRKYCSKECQVGDWNKMEGHRLYCSIAGEIGFDYEIRQVDDEIGMGLFALRDIKKNEKVLAERPILRWPYVSQRSTYPETQDVPESARMAVDALVPQTGALPEKLKRNCFVCSSEGDSGFDGLFLTMSRVNHCCLPNADKQFLENRGVAILVASRDIPKGEEVRISYKAKYMPWDERRAILVDHYRFQCNCVLCNDSGLEKKLAFAQRLEDDIMNLGCDGQIEAAMITGEALLGIYDELNFSSWKYYCRYYDLFQVAITKRKFAEEQGNRYIRLAYEAVLAYTEDDQDDQVKRMKSFVANPQSHGNHLCLG
jgi:hypothetical protein